MYVEVFAATPGPLFQMRWELIGILQELTVRLLPRINGWCGTLRATIQNVGLVPHGALWNAVRQVQQEQSKDHDEPPPVPRSLLFKTV
jgi:hypothetical protein